MNINTVLLSTIFEYEEDCDGRGIKDFYSVNNIFGDEFKLEAMLETFKSAGIFRF